MATNESDVTAEANIARTMRNLMRPGESVKAFHRRLANQLRWKFSRVREAWYERAAIRPHEIDEVDALHKREKAAEDVLRELSVLVEEARAILAREDRAGIKDRRGRGSGDKGGRAMAERVR